MKVKKVNKFGDIANGSRYVPCNKKISPYNRTNTLKF